jgi:hypothetical protein
MRGVCLALIGVFGLVSVAVSAVADEMNIAQEIFRGLNTPRDVPVAFVEFRGNALLAEPLELRGSVIFSADGELSKIITDPVRESVVISPEHIRLERDGSTREFPLGKQKGVREFYLGLRALLGGDFDTVRELFEISAIRSGDGNDWRIELIPRKQRMKRFMEYMIVSGAGSTVTRIRTVQSADDWQEMIFDPVGRD